MMMYIKNYNKNINLNTPQIIKLYIVKCIIINMNKFSYPQNAIVMKLNTREAREHLDECTNCIHQYSSHWCWTFQDDGRTFFRCKFCDCDFKSAPYNPDLDVIDNN